MRFYGWKTLGQQDPDLCFLDEAPRDLGARSFHLAQGKPVKELYPADPRIYLSEKNPGIRLESFIGNTKRMLVVSPPLRTILEKWCQGQDIEYLPVHIYDHRQRLYTRDYTIINPLGSLDCLDRERSVITMLNGKVVRVRRMVLSPEKVKHAAHLFRVLEDPSVYVISETLANAIKEGGGTNVALNEMDMAVP